MERCTVFEVSLRQCTVFEVSLKQCGIIAKVYRV